MTADFKVCLADKWQQQVRFHFPEAIVQGFEHLEPLMTNDEGDRHVLAAAVWGQAEVIVTFKPIMTIQKLWKSIPQCSEVVADELGWELEA